MHLYDQDIPSQICAVFDPQKNAITTWVKGGGLVIWRLQRSQRKILDRHPQPKAHPKKKRLLFLP